MFAAKKRPMASEPEAEADRLPRPGLNPVEDAEAIHPTQDALVRCMRWLGRESARTLVCTKSWLRD